MLPVALLAGDGLRWWSIGDLNVDFHNEDDWLHLDVAA